MQLGILLSDQGRCEVAEPFLAAQSLLDALLQETPDSTAYRHATALLCLNRGANLGRLDRFPEACPVLERGIEVAESLEQALPGNPEYSAILVDLENNLDVVRNPLGNTDPDQMARTLERARRAVAARPEVPEYQEDLARCLNNHAVNLEGAGRWNEALAVYSESLGVCEELVRKTPQATLYRELLVRTLANRSEAYAALGRDEDAEKSFRRALEEVEPLVASPEKAPIYRVLQAQTVKGLQALLRKFGRGEEAEQLARQVIQQFETMRVADADSVNVLHDLAGAHLSHGCILNDLKRYPEALAAFERAEKTIVEAFGRSEPSPQMGYLLALTLENRGDVQRTLGNFTESDAAYRESIRLTEKLVQDDKDNPQHRSNLLRTISHLAELYLQSNRLIDAEPEMAHGIEIGERLVNEFPKIAGYHRQLIDLMSYQIELQLKRSDFRAASTLAARSLELADAAVALAPGDPRLRGLPREAANNAMAVAQQANDLPTQHRAISRLIELEPEDTETRQCTRLVTGDLPGSHTARSRPRRAAGTRGRGQVARKFRFPEHTGRRALSPGRPGRGDSRTDRGHPTAEARRSAIRLQPLFHGDGAVAVGPPQGSPRVLQASRNIGQYAIRLRQKAARRAARTAPGRGTRHPRTGTVNGRGANPRKPAGEFAVAATAQRPTPEARDARSARPGRRPGNRTARTDLGARSESHVGPLCTGD